MSQFNQQELDEIYAFAVDLGKRAGKLLLDGIDKRVEGVGGSGELAFEEKDSAVDIVTQTDEGWYCQSSLFISNTLEREAAMGLIVPSIYVPSGHI